MKYDIYGVPIPPPLRIIERTYPDGSVSFIIQQYVTTPNNMGMHWVNCAFKNRAAVYATLEDAKKDLCWFDGTTNIDKTVWESEKQK